MTAVVRLDPAPLLVVAETRVRSARTDDQMPRTVASAAELAELLGVCGRTVHRWRHGGLLSEWMADELAVRLNLHPISVWGDDWPEPSDLDLEAGDWL